MILELAPHLSRNCHDESKRSVSVEHNDEDADGDNDVVQDDNRLYTADKVCLQPVEVDVLFSGSDVSYV